MPKRGTQPGTPYRRFRPPVAALLVLATSLALLRAPALWAANLLQNPSFETFTQYGVDPIRGAPLQEATGWHRFVEQGSPYLMSTSGFNATWGCNCWVERLDGEDSQFIFSPTPWEPYVAGMYQQVTGVTPGAAYAASGRLVSTSLLSAGGVRVGRKIGLDPYGGKDPKSPNVIWGEERWGDRDDRWMNFMVSAVAQASTITVFVRANHPSAGSNEVMIDITTVDVAPVAHVSAMPLYRHQAAFDVSWTLDSLPSDSAFTSFDVQVKDGSSGAWTGWLTETTATSALFSGAEGHTYHFQARAMARAIPWPGNRLIGYYANGGGQVQTTVDATPPTSGVNALSPYQRTAAFPVSWWGSDAASGIAGYDVQVRDGAVGMWTGWLTGTTATGGTFAGQDGHTYAFRSRAKDRADNLEALHAGVDATTTVDILPPTAQMAGLPLNQVTATFPVTWTGHDAVSGVAAFDVQSRSVRLSDDADSGWLPWLTGTALTGAVFAGQDETLYSFRARATDGAGNASVYPASPQPSTTILSHAQPALAASTKVTSQQYIAPGHALTYTILLANSGSLSATVWMTDTPPVAHARLLTPTVQASAGTLTVSQGAVTWNGLVASGQAVTIGFALWISDTAPVGARVFNHAWIDDGWHRPFTRTAVAVVPFRSYLPLVLRATP